MTKSNLTILEARYALIGDWLTERPNYPFAPGEFMQAVGVVEEKRSAINQTFVTLHNHTLARANRTRYEKNSVIGRLFDRLWAEGHGGLVYRTARGVYVYDTSARIWATGIAKNQWPVERGPDKYQPAQVMVPENHLPTPAEVISSSNGIKVIEPTTYEVVTPTPTPTTPSILILHREDPSLILKIDNEIVVATVVTSIKPETEA